MSEEINVVRKPNIHFRIGHQHKDFKEKIAEELYAMDILKIRYVIFDRDDILLPHLEVDGYAVAGLTDIKHELWEAMINYVRLLEQRKND